MQRALWKLKFFSFLVFVLSEPSGFVFVYQCGLCDSCLMHAYCLYVFVHYRRLSYYFGLHVSFIGIFLALDPWHFLSLFTCSERSDSPELGYESRKSRFVSLLLLPYPIFVPFNASIIDSLKIFYQTLLACFHFLINILIEAMMSGFLIVNVIWIGYSFILVYHLHTIKGIITQINCFEKDYGWTTHYLILAKKEQKEERRVINQTLCNANYFSFSCPCGVIFCSSFYHYSPLM